MIYFCYKEEKKKVEKNIRDKTGMRKGFWDCYEMRQQKNPADNVCENILP